MSDAFPGALMAPPTASVQENLDALQAERDDSWDAEQLRSHEAFRLSHEEEAGSRRMVREGDVVSPFTLPEVDGGAVALTDLLATGPVVLIFFRFEGCPACNAAWSAYQLSLAPVLQELGVHLVGVSPQAPEKLVAIKRRHDFQFQIASDPDASLIHEFGIGFAPAEEEREKQLPGLAAYLPPPEPGVNRDIGSFQGEYMRFGAKHNDIFPLLGDMIRWKLGLPNRHLGDK